MYSRVGWGDMCSTKCKNNTLTTLGWMMMIIGVLQHHLFQRIIIFVAIIE